MSVEVNLVGIACNLDCPYCYQHEMRNAGNIKKAKNLSAVKETLTKINGKFGLFGGEALLGNLDDIEEMFKFGLEKHNSNSIQTNGTLITDKHIELFKKYKVHVGISLDGPGEMNDSRWAGTLEKTREATKKTHENIDKLLLAGIVPSLIITLYRKNASKENLKDLCEWLLKLDRKGIKSVRIHALEVDQKEVQETMALSPEENFRAFVTLNDLEQKELKNIKFDVFKDIRALLSGDDEKVTCVWNACDQYSTLAVQGVDENGDQHNCGRTNKQGVNWFKSDSHGKERQLALYNTPWEHGGCKGCRFFIHCKGQCTGTGESGDWRNKSDQCSFWYMLLEHIEQEMLLEGKLPTSLHPNLKGLEQIMMTRWAAGNHCNIKQALQFQGNPKAFKPDFDHGDSHGDAPHGDHSDDGGSEDKPHGDSHGDIPHGDA